MRVYAYDTFHFTLPADHRFPVAKYPSLRQHLLEAGILSPSEINIPEAATRSQLELVHTPDYVSKVFEGRLSEKETRRIGFPWSPGLVERSCRSVGATIAVCRAALEDGISASLAGGTHHAYPDHGEGYCVFNDVAVAARVMQQEGCLRRVVILDLDVHQGNGTAAIFAGDPSVYTFSVHGRKNFPYHKETSDLDVALPDATSDGEYLEAVEQGTLHALAHACADLAIYLAGADPFAGDRLGRMAVSKLALAERDHLVLDLCQQAGLPIAITMSGGYAKEVTDIVDIHSETIRIAKEFSSRNLFSPLA